MKIGIAYTQVYPSVGGASGADRRVRDIARGLSQDENLIFMYVPEWLNSGKENMDILDYKIIYVNTLFNKIPILNRLFFWNKLARCAHKDKLDAVIFYTPTIDSSIAALQIKRKGIISVMEFCDLISSNYSGSLRGFIMWLGESQLPKINQTVFVISTFLKDAVKKCAPKTPAVILPILVDTKLFKPDDVLRENFRHKYEVDDNCILISYVGGMWSNYGVDNLIEAFSILSQKTNKQVKLIIAGSLNKNAECVDAVGLINKFNLQDKSILTGLVATDEVLGILNASDILTVPHNDDILNKAGLPTKLAEYSSVGKAVIASNLGDISLYFSHKENAYLVEGSNLNSLSDGLLELVENTHLRNSIAQNARKTALNVFDYKINGQNMLAVIKELKRTN
jgi:glycosyltransferase involved in cell wall biosynthesis